MKHFLFIPASLLVLLAGCREGVARREARDRLLPGMQAAIAAEQDGRYDDAITHYRAALAAEPSAAGAHFSLGILYQEHAADYVEAMHHYRRYLEDQPGADKQPLAEERLLACERALAAELIRRHPGVAAAAHATTAREIERYKEKAATLETEKDALAKAKAELELTLKSRDTDIARLERLVNQLKDLKPTPASTPAPRPRIEIPDLEKEKARAAKPPAATKPPAAKPSSTAKPAPVATPASVPHPRPKTHTVRAGDTLYGIAEKLYGDASRWRDIRAANEDRLKDGRIRVGQELIIP